MKTTWKSSSQRRQSVKTAPALPLTTTTKGGSRQESLLRRTSNRNLKSTRRKPAEPSAILWKLEARKIRQEKVKESLQWPISQDVVCTAPVEAHTSTSKTMRSPTTLNIFSNNNNSNSWLRLTHPYIISVESSKDKLQKIWWSSCQKRLRYEKA